MASSRLVRVLVIFSLVVILAAIPIIGTACTGQNTSGIIANNLAATMVPDIDLDAYLYFNQGSPIAVPGNLFNLPAEVKVDSVAIWGVVNGSLYSVGGALNFANAADASSVYSLIIPQTDAWTKLVDRTIYLVQGSGGPAESLKAAISNNHFKHYDNSLALEEVSRLPVSDTSRPIAVGILKISQPLIELLKKYLDADTADTINSIYTWGKPQMMVTGLYLPQPVDLADIGRRIYNNTIWDANIGVVASINSSLPGVVVGPVATKFLDDNGYTKAETGNLTIYKTSVNSGFGKNIPILINVDGNRVFTTSSVNESYAQTLMAGIKR